MRWTDADKTPWFASHKKPKRVGVYEVTSYVGTGWCYWDGKSWGWTASSPHNAELSNTIGGSQSKEWRGLRYEV